MSEGCDGSSSLSTVNAHDAAYVSKRRWRREGNAQDNEQRKEKEGEEEKVSGKQRGRERKRGGLSS